MKKTFNSENMHSIQKNPYNKQSLKQNKYYQKKISPNDLIYLQENNQNLKIYYDKN